MSVRMLALGLALATTTVAGKEAVAIQVSPTVSFAPANLVIRTRVEPDGDNRAIEVVADSGEFYRSSTIPLEGDGAPKTTSVEFRSLPAGEYDVTAAVIGMDGQRKALAHAHINVVASGR